MRIKQFELYREDIRDLVELTVAKMDNYLIVNTLQLGFCVALYTEGRLENHPGEHPDYPPWMQWLYQVGTHMINMVVRIPARSFTYKSTLLTLFPFQGVHLGCLPVPVNVHLARNARVDCGAFVRSASSDTIRAVAGAKFETTRRSASFRH
jgi:hypothetical protein